MGIFQWVSDFVSAWQGGDYAAADNASVRPTASTPVRRREKTSKVITLVRQRRGSMYMDEDGDLAHEFYREDESGKLVRVDTGLRPQGLVNVFPPSLNKDAPVLMLPAGGDLDPAADAARAVHHKRGANAGSQAARSAGPAKTAKTPAAHAAQAPAKTATGNAKSKKNKRKGGRRG